MLVPPCKWTEPNKLASKDRSPICDFEIGLMWTTHEREDLFGILLRRGETLTIHESKQNRAVFSLKREVVFNLRKITLNHKLVIRENVPLPPSSSIEGPCEISTFTFRLQLHSYLAIIHTEERQSEKHKIVIGKSQSLARIEDQRVPKEQLPPLAVLHRVVVPHSLDFSVHRW
ncbi:hypothetical protein E5288_WYG011876 [Bos mutus]|uniref:Uncharacterized protein n=1 Tax=Bos mutus TaxID=72004 RepID=A0A6B0QX10_9CETA|nr:hypothetical protein [Bos mutus]